VTSCGLISYRVDGPFLSANRGIGFHLVKYLASLPSGEQSLRIIATARSPSTATDLTALKNASDTRAQIEIVELDTTNEDSIKQSAESVKGFLGEKEGIDYFIANAAVVSPLFVCRCVMMRVNFFFVSFPLVPIREGVTMKLLRKLLLIPFIN
jgi:NAD(P)-dependent dehydrogenase (short-subunit alcohol dehydrogenase family)